MINRTTVEAVFLDHSYCSQVSFFKEFTSQTKAAFIMADSGETLSWEEEMGIEFEPPSIEGAQLSSSLSPSHSVDSGFDNDLNLFGDLNLDLEDLETLLSEEVNSKKVLSPKKTPSTNTVTSTSTSTLPSTSTSASSMGKRPTTKRKVMEDPIDEVEKNRKNAIAARENRLKKKKYIESIEKENEELKKENESLKAKDRVHSKTVEKLETEVAYLRNVIANQSALSALLKNLVSTPGITFTSSFTEQEPVQIPAPPKDDNVEGHDDDDRPYKTRSRKRNSSAAGPGSSKKPRKDIKGGVCLHVSQDKVSLELCDQCSIKAHGCGHD